jgi:hypothetical protein
MAVDRRFASVEVCALAILPPSVEYTDKDFDALRARLIALVKSVFPDWSDFSVASFGNVLLEMYAFVGDVIAYYLDAQARESRLVTATQRKNVIALARMLGYRPHGAKAATAEVVFTLPRPPTADVVIAAGTVVRTQEVTEPVRFQLLGDVLVPAGADPPIVTGVVENSQTHSQLFDARGLGGLDIVLDRLRTSMARQWSQLPTGPTSKRRACSPRGRTIATSCSSSTRTTARRFASATAPEGRPPLL